MVMGGIMAMVGCILMSGCGVKDMAGTFNERSLDFPPYQKIQRAGRMESTSR